MIAINKPLIALTAMVAVGLVAVIDMAQSSPREPSAAAAVAARFPAPSEIMVAHNVGLTTQAAAQPKRASKARKDAPASCVHEHWPYIADECLVAEDSVEPRRPTRTIQIERSVASANTAIVR